MEGVAAGHALFPEKIGALILIYALPLLLGLGWALMGYALWSGVNGDARRPVPAR